MSVPVHRDRRVVRRRPMICADPLSEWQTVGASLGCVSERCSSVSKVCGRESPCQLQHCRHQRRPGGAHVGPDAVTANTWENSPTLWEQT